MRNPSSPLAALLALLFAAAPAQSAGRAYVPRVTLTPSMGPIVGAPGFRPEMGRGLVGGTSLNPHALTPTLQTSLLAASVAPAPSIISAAPVAPADAPVHLAADAVAAPAAASVRLTADAAAPADAPRPAATALESLRALAAPADGPRWVKGAGFDGESRRGRDAAPGSDYVINDEGVRINDRAARYYTEVRRLVDQYKGQIDLEESLDVMDDAYGDVLAKVSAVEAVAKGRGLTRENTHLEETLVWVDGVLTDGTKKVAVHTHRVFFHRAKNPQSEIQEGIRRVDGYIDEAEKMFARGGKAERQLGQLDEVELVFDARGYQEIKDHLKARGEKLAAATNGRITFKFTDELAPLPREQAAIRARLNELSEIYNGKGLSKIYEGVIYSRYVGLLLELKTVEHYHKLGYKILQSGRELFDAQGMYVTELDVVVQSPEGKVLLVEAKSARVGLPNQEVLEDKVVYKLRTYQKHRAALEAMIGHKIDQVVFAMDVAVDPDMDPALVLPKDQRKLELVTFLRANESSVSQRFGFPTTFLFLQSGPRQSGPRMGLAPSSGRGGRKHGRDRRR